MALLDKIEKELKERQQKFWDDVFKKNQAALTVHQARIDSLCEPSEETLKFNAVLEPLGFDHGGEFYPIEYSVDDYEFTEIGKSAIATSDNHILVLNYSLMEFWESFKNSDELRKLAIKAVSELEDIAS